MFVECQVESFALTADGTQNYTWLIHTMGKGTAGMPSNVIVVRRQGEPLQAIKGLFYVLWRCRSNHMATVADTQLLACRKDGVLDFNCRVPQMMSLSATRRCAHPHQILISLLIRGPIVPPSKFANTFACSARMARIPGAP